MSKALYLWTKPYFLRGIYIYRLILGFLNKTNVASVHVYDSTQWTEREQMGVAVSFWEINVRDRECIEFDICSFQEIHKLAVESYSYPPLHFSRCSCEIWQNQISFPELAAVLFSCLEICSCCCSDFKKILECWFFFPVCVPFRIAISLAVCFS